MAKEDASVQYFESKLSRNPQSLVFSRLAESHLKNGEIQQAIGVCTLGLQNHPNHTTARVILGRCFLEQEKFREAIGEFVKAVKEDRRNQVAVKMIADICARQGMKEKAGDLYAYLFGLDPDNQTLAELAGSFSGTGDTDVMRILGMGAAAREPAAGETSPEAIADVEKTIQLDLGPLRSRRPPQKEGDLSEMMVKTQQFDPRELGTAAGVTEEIAAESPGMEAGVVTGDDISSRMAMMFGEQEPAASAVEPEVLDHVDIGTDKANGPDEEIGLATVKGVETGVVSGSDISSRIEQLFGEEEAPTIASKADYTGDADKQESLEETLMQQPTSADPVREESRDELRPVESSDISGQDITSRLNEMFDEVPSPAPLSDDSLSVEETPVGDVSDTAIGPVSDEADDVQPKSVDDTPEEEITIGGAEPAPPPTPEGVISGDDVSLRLETIFDEGEADQPTDGARGEEIPDHAADATDVSRADKAPALAEDTNHPGEDTKPPIDIGEGAIVIGDGGDALESASETLIVSGAGTPAPVESTSQQVSEETPDIDDAVGPEIEDSAPGMSGDDVAGRMDDLFGDESTEGALGSAEPMPESDNEDEAVGRELDTTPGEIAEPAGSGDVPVFELDKMDAAGPESDTLDLAREPEERTVLMDEEGEDTMPAEEETILSGSRDPFLAAPVSGPGASDETEVRETASAETTEPPESGDVPVFELDKMDAAGPESDTLDLAREPEERTVLMDEEGEDTMPAEEETILSGSRDPFLAAPVSGPSEADETEVHETAGPVPAHADIAKEESAPGSDPDQTQVFSIPDHVLTPTLADIYYQQGQPKLALQLYRRLLHADPDNERIAKRIREIEATFASQEVEETIVLDVSPKETAVQVGPALQAQPAKKRKQRSAAKPLSGVRIKKKFKSKAGRPQ